MQITLYFRCSFLILGLFLMGVGSAWGQEQEYRPMLGEFGKWHEYFTLLGGANTTLLIDGDTIVNGTSYKKINIIEYEEVIGQRLLREDTLEKKVYELWWHTEPEALLYDFSLLPGDTFFRADNLFVVLDSISDIITNPFFCGNINFIPILEIENPRIFYFHGASYPLVWIEGIGSLTGLLNDYEWGGGVSGSTLLCHFNEKREKDFHYIYCEESAPCQGINTNTTTLQKASIEVYPNPTADVIYIKNIESLYQTTLYLYDVNGVEKIKLKNPKTLNLNQLPNGVYLLKIILDDQHIAIHKIIKQ